MKILHINRAELAGPSSLHLTFSDGCVATVDLRSLLTGPVFEPLHDPAYFAKFQLDPLCKTVCWPNGADLAPEAIRALAPKDQTASGQVGTTSVR